MKEIKTVYYTLRYKNGELFDNTLSIDTKEHAIRVRNEIDKDLLIVCAVKKTTYILDNGRFFKEEATITACP